MAESIAGSRIPFSLVEHMTVNKQAVIFDMDGTLTRQNLDFAAIRREIGLGPEPVLETITEMSSADRARAEAILERHEAEAAANCELQPGAGEVIQEIRARGIAAALMTRNSRRSVDVFRARHGVGFDLIWTREDGPMKPSPEPIFHICRKLGVSAGDAWVVGDFHFDIICGAGAGARTVLFVEAGRQRPDWAGEADYVIDDLRELLNHMGLAAPASGEGRRRGEGV
jgi:HAD superfamily hydrolase (TIGR01549 family)